MSAESIDWNAVLKDIEKQVLALAESTLKDYLNEAKSDAAALLATSKDTIVKAGESLAKGEIDSDMFQSEVRGQLDDAEFLALETAGLGQVRIDKFVTGVVNIVTSVAMTAAGKLF